MLNKDTLISLTTKHNLNIIFKNTSFEIITPVNYLFYDGKKSKEYVYENFLVNTLKDGKQNAIIYAYFEIKNNATINLKDKKFEAPQCNSTINC
ncbi:MAG: hypothetical protein ACNI3C_05895 [Candidatus Marinarcus sp.]|uniref:hypothetical protein n=1 Tax=Candidatus Marinarcus sp. TaxID=3100987 RepID=UPI003B00616C